MLAPAADRKVTNSHNNPPGPIQCAHEAMIELSAFLKEHPVVSTSEEAKLGAGFIERTRVALSDMETERSTKVAPLNAELSKINATYRVVREPLESAMKRLRSILTAFASAEEQKRIAEANRLRADAEAAEAAARAAEAREQDEIARADVGECTDVGAAIADADCAFREFQKADKARAIAERNVPVRLGSIMGNRALSMRTVEVLKVTDVHAAIKAMGVTPEIEQAILSAARKHRKAFEELPPGVTATFERSM
jgi:hypothetical protein